MKSNSEILSLLQTAIQAAFFDDAIRVSFETSAVDVDGWDSLSHVRVLMEIERMLNVELSEEESLRAKNVGELVELISGRISQRHD